MNYNSTYAMAAICGDVSISPERQAYGENNSKELVRFTLSVKRSGFNEAPPTYTPFQIACNGKLAELALTLQRGQRALVILDMYNKQAESKGYVFDNISIWARHILPFPMPQQKQETQGQQQPQQTAPAQQQPRILQNQGIQYNPQQDMQNRMQQQGNMSSTDIPF